MIPERYVWMVWACTFLIPWALLYWALPQHRRAMLWAAAFTAPFGLTEPFFVPEYWDPPSLFDLAHRTGFDIESPIFSFGIGGIGAVLYNVATGRAARPMDSGAMHGRRHRYHQWAIAAPLIAFPPLYALPWNPIYPAIAAMAIGAAAAAACRPDLAAKTGIGGLLFLVYYALFLWGLEWLSPGYIGRVWNLAAISGVVVLRLPLEELLFAFAFGMYWSGVYEHFTWKRLQGQR